LLLLLVAAVRVSHAAAPLLVTCRLRLRLGRCDGRLSNHDCCFVLLALLLLLLLLLLLPL
jgi:hypothetical protein